MTDKKEIRSIEKKFTSGHILQSIREKWNSINFASIVRMTESKVFALVGRNV